ncbi:hypothetical protein ACIQVO_36830 [Streptomyces sp. NPDC101062]|uniref:hypothetical protein n=1 Tax=unclassified Streptomyces TaxID=2593676 RepID=UPI0038136A8D
MTAAPAEQYTGTVTAGPGGAMTDEVGVITGDLTLTTSARPDGQADVRVQYTGAEEWYTLAGSPTPIPPGEGLRGLHARVLEAVRHGGLAALPE